MNMRLFNRLWAVIALVVGMIFAASPVFAAKDKKAPTTPTNLRVTGTSAYSVSLAWNPSTDNSRSVIYTICCANASSETFPGPTSTRVYTAGLEAGRTFTLRISARDPSGNLSGYSNAVTFTLPADITPPAKPSLSMTDVGATHVSLAWTSTDDGPHIWFNVWMDGHAILSGSRDSAGNQSAPAALTTCAGTFC